MYAPTTPLKNESKPSHNSNSLRSLLLLCIMHFEICKLFGGIKIICKKKKKYTLLQIEDIMTHVIASTCTVLYSLYYITY